MGFYVNPVDGSSKEEWLEANGREITDPDTLSVTPEELPVILVDNGPFTAAGIAYSREELRAFLQPYDHRPKRYYLVPRKALEPWLPAVYGGTPPAVTKVEVK